MSPRRDRRFPRNSSIFRGQSRVPSASLPRLLTRRRHGARRRYRNPARSVRNEAHIRFQIRTTTSHHINAHQSPRHPDASNQNLISSNRERIKQVLFNLFLNSLEAATSSPVQILVRSSGGKDGQARIDVIDNGPGIPPELSQKIFDPFFTTKSRGTGLGLATVARILKAAKSEIHLLPSSSGAHFQLIVPASSSMELAGTAS